MSESLVIGDLYFALQRSGRKTVGITIEREGELILTAPYDCPLEAIERIAEEKRFWIYTKLAEKELLFNEKTEKEYVNGEGFYYLGRSYRLLLIRSLTSASLRLHQGRFMLRYDQQSDAQKHFINWYIEHAQPWLQHRVNLFANRIGVSPNTIQVRDLGFRWGSCSINGNLNFHWRTIRLPPRIIEYIVAHELVHLHEPHHDAQFWKRLECAMPDFASRKQWLAENGSRF
ncbi:SprT family zinc-dependent metalloprotease [Microcoleus sp. herbarium14]|uniref:M48 family metallopeptidase n=1 Tax=Microcoleus sp. herbarium14 TaxID=3055439 RepID=UPI002FD2A453